MRAVKNSLSGVIVSRVSGILNGVDTAVWAPEAEAAPYSAKKMKGKATARAALQAEFGVEVAGPLAIVVSRLTDQKGIDLLPQVVPDFVAQGGGVIILGSGDPALEAAMRGLEARFPGKVAVRIGYDEGLSHRMFSGADAVLVPSRFEPCGLTQLYGLAYACVPVVARTGGLADTVIDANLAALNAGVATGVQFTGVHYGALTGAIDRAMRLYHTPGAWQMLQRNGMKADFSWTNSGAAYATLYRELTGTQ